MSGSSSTLAGVVSRLQDELQRLSRMLPVTNLVDFEDARIDASRLAAFIKELQAMRSGLEEDHQQQKSSVFDELLPALAALRDVILVKDAIPLRAEEFKQQCERIQDCVAREAEPLHPEDFPTFYDAASKADLQGIRDLHGIRTPLIPTDGQALAKHFAPMLQRLEAALGGAGGSTTVLDDAVATVAKTVLDIKTSCVSEPTAATATTTNTVDITVYAFPDPDGKSTADWECRQAHVQYGNKVSIVRLEGNVANGDLTLSAAAGVDVKIEKAALRNAAWFRETGDAWFITGAGVEGVGPISLTNATPAREPVRLWVQRAPFEVTVGPKATITVRDRETKDVVTASGVAAAGIVPIVYTGKDKMGDYRHGLELYVDPVHLQAMAASPKTPVAVGGRYVPVLSAYAVTDVADPTRAAVKGVTLAPVGSALTARTDQGSTTYVRVGTLPEQEHAPWWLHLVDHGATAVAYGRGVHPAVLPATLYGTGPTTDRWWKRDVKADAYEVHRRVEAKLAATAARHLRAQTLYVYEAYCVAQRLAAPTAAAGGMANLDCMKDGLRSMYQRRLCDRMKRVVASSCPLCAPWADAKGQQQAPPPPSALLVDNIIALQRDGHLSILSDFFAVPADRLPSASARLYTFDEVRSLYDQFLQYLRLSTEAQASKLRSLGQLMLQLSSDGSAKATEIATMFANITAATTAAVAAAAPAASILPTSIQMVGAYKEYVAQAAPVVDAMMALLRERDDPRPYAAADQAVSMSLRASAQDASAGVMQRLTAAYRAEMQEMLPEFERRLKRMTEQLELRSKTMTKEMSSTKARLQDFIETANKNVAGVDAKDDDTRSRYVEYKARKLMGFVDAYLSMYAAYRDFHVGFAVRSFREPLRLIRRMLKELPDDKRSPLLGKIAAQLATVRQKHAAFTAEFEKTFAETFAAASGIRDHFHDYDLQRLRDRLEAAHASVSDMSEKILAVYNNDIGLSDMLRDTQFMLLYVVKFVRFFIMWCSLFLAESVFTNWYVDAVYTKKTAPPSLAYFVGLFVGIEAALFVILWVILALVRHINDHDGHGFVIDAGFMQKLMADYAISTVLIALMGLVIGEVIQKRVVFNYAADGVAPVKAYKDILLALAGFTLIVPYFTIVG